MLPQDSYKVTQEMALKCASIADPEVHPQNEDYWGHVNPIGPRACYDEGKRVAETMCYAYMKQVLLFSLNKLGIIVSIFFQHYVYI